MRTRWNWSWVWVIALLLVAASADPELIQETEQPTPEASQPTPEVGQPAAQPIRNQENRLRKPRHLQRRRPKGKRNHLTRLGRFPGSDAARWAPLFG